MIQQKQISGAGTPAAHASSHSADGTDALIGYDVASGFPNRTASALSMSGAYLQLTKTGTSFDVYTAGVKHTYTTTQQVEITNERTLHFCYIDTDGTLKVGTDAWDIEGDAAPVAMVYKSGANYAIFDERHHALRDRSNHASMHATVGARFASGGAGTFGDSTFSIAQVVIWDEDLKHDTGGTLAACRMWYRYTGAAALTFEGNVTTPTKTIQFDSSGTLTNADTSKFWCQYFYATNDKDYPIACVVGQAQHATIALARNDTLPSLPGMATREWKLLYRATYKNVGGSPVYQEAQDFREVSTGPASNYTPASHANLTNRDAADSHPASAIQPSTTNFNSLLSSSDDTVQKALDTLDNHSHAETGRTLLTEDTTYYVRTDGDDAHDGSANDADHAFLTIQAAINYVANFVDAGGNVVTIQVGAGTYTGAVQLLTIPGARGLDAVVLKGDSATPANVVLSVTGDTCINSIFCNTAWCVDGFKLTTTAAGYCIYANVGVVTFKNINFGACAGSHIVAVTGGYIQASGDYTISGNATQHVYASGPQASVGIAGVTITLSGSRAFTKFVLSYYLAYVLANGITFSGSATGKRYEGNYNALIVTSGGGASYFPGDASGSVANGALYT